MKRLSEAQRIEAENLEIAREFFAGRFAELEDPRRAQGLRYPLSLVVISALLASVAGADDAQAMETWSRINADWLSGFLDMPHGSPSQDVYLAVFATLDPRQFESVFRAWANWLRIAGEGAEHIAIDGKTSRGSRSETGVALHSLNAWLVGSGLVLGQHGTQGKGNEITAIPKLLEKLDLRGAVVSIDAIGCQRAIAEQIVEADADYFLQVKKNQSTLLSECKYAFESAVDAETGEVIASDDSASYEETTKGHGRIETRRATVSTDLARLKEATDWPEAESVVRVERSREVQQTGNRATEVAYYVSSVMDLSPARALALSRDHWTIENQLHWVLDVAFGEDHARHRAKNAAENISLLRKWALNLIRTRKNRKGGVKNNRKQAGWDRSYLVELIANPAWRE